MSSYDLLRVPGKSHRRSGSSGGGGSTTSSSSRRSSSSSKPKSPFDEEVTPDDSISSVGVKKDKEHRKEKHQEYPRSSKLSTIGEGSVAPSSVLSGVSRRSVQPNDMNAIVPYGYKESSRSRGGTPSVASERSGSHRSSTSTAKPPRVPAIRLAPPSEVDSGFSNASYGSKTSSRAPSNTSSRHSRPPPSLAPSYAGSSASNSTLRAAPPSDVSYASGRSSQAPSNTGSRYSKSAQSLAPSYAGSSASNSTIRAPGSDISRSSRASGASRSSHGGSSTGLIPRSAPMQMARGGYSDDAGDVIESRHVHVRRSGYRDESGREVHTEQVTRTTKIDPVPRSSNSRSSYNGSSYNGYDDDY